MCKKQQELPRKSTQTRILTNLEGARYRYLPEENEAKLFPRLYFLLLLPKKPCSLFHWQPSDPSRSLLYIFTHAQRQTQQHYALPAVGQQASAQADDRRRIVIALRPADTRVPRHQRKLCLAGRAKGEQEREEEGKPKEVAAAFNQEKENLRRESNGQGKVVNIWKKQCGCGDNGCNEPCKKVAHA